MSFLPASPWDYLTSSKEGVTRFDARRSFEVGSFVVSSWAFVYLTVHGNLTEFFFIGYMATWTTAKYLRDREQRLNNGAKS